ncbi:hypothetical protein [Altibacter sp.]|uniref:hypothetical protein n=1 Tax=Altibacter sp. TaxID=2024823 RepID=UPI000C8F2C00|nr:hypothetical protein [Altibacter sp.]MAP54194.1 hypothetical protein [Altibacter sp.]
MSDLSEIVDSLENRISKLLHRHEILKQSNAALTEELQLLKTRQEEYENDIQQWQEKCTSLKLANSILGSDQHKRETKLKINALVREIDLCIAQLSE